MFGRVPHTPYAPEEHRAHPLLRQVALAVGIAVLLAATALLLLPPKANGNFVYWTSGGTDSSIGRAKINGAGLNNDFITGLNDVRAVAVDDRFIYWTEGAAGDSSIGRANLDGSGVNPSFITTGVVNPVAIAVTDSGIYWSGSVTMTDEAIGRANLDGSGATADFIPIAESSCGLATDPSFVYFLAGLAIGRAPLGGGAGDPSFAPIPEPFCGLAVDPSFLYWGSDSGNTVGRIPVAGGTAEPGFVQTGTTSGGPSGVAVNSQYVFWGNYDADAIGRANINGGAPNPSLIPGAAITGPVDASQLIAAPSNKVTINSVTRKKKKGTATINAKVPGPGQVTLANSGEQDPDASVATVKKQGLTITAASSFKLAVKPVGKTAKKLKKQLKKKSKAKAKVKVFVTFVPAGVAGVPNSAPVTITLLKQKKRKKKKGEK